MDGRLSLREHPGVIVVSHRSPPLSVVAWILVAAAALLYPFTLYLGLAAGDRVPQLLQFDWWAALSPLVVIEFDIVGALILRRHAGHAVGSLALVGGLCTSLSDFAGAYAAYSLTHGHLCRSPGSPFGCVAGSGTQG